MPLYEYRCPVCDLVFEELRRPGDDADAPCPECGLPAPRIVSLSAFALKGNGFYATDYVNRRPGSFQKDGKGTIKGVAVDVPCLARDPSQPLDDETAGDPEATPDDDPKEGA